MGLAGTATSSSILLIKMSEKTADTGPLIGYPSFCFTKQEFGKNAFLILLIIFCN